MKEDLKIRVTSFDGTRQCEHDKIGGLVRIQIFKP